MDLLEEPREFRGGFLDAQAHQSERTALVEDDRENDAARDQRHVEIVALPLMKMDGELVLADELGEPAGRGDAARGEGREARRVEAPDIARFGEELTVLVDDEDAFGVGVARQPLTHREDPAVIVVVEHQLSIDDRHLRP